MAHHYNSNNNNKGSNPDDLIAGFGQLNLQQRDNNIDNGYGTGNRNYDSFRSYRDTNNYDSDYDDYDDNYDDEEEWEEFSNECFDNEENDYYYSSSEFDSEGEEYDDDDNDDEGHWYPEDDDDYSGGYSDEWGPGDEEAYESFCRKCGRARVPDGYDGEEINIDQDEYERYHLCRGRGRCHYYYDDY